MKFAAKGALTIALLAVYLSCSSRAAEAEVRARIRQNQMEKTQSQRQRESAEQQQQQQIVEMQRLPISFGAIESDVFHSDNEANVIDVEPPSALGEDESIYSAREAGHLRQRAGNWDAKAMVGEDPNPNEETKDMDEEDSFCVACQDDCDAENMCVRCAGCGRRAMCKTCYAEYARHQYTQGLQQLENREVRRMPQLACPLCKAETPFQHLDLPHLEDAIREQQQQLDEERIKRYLIQAIAIAIGVGVTYKMSENGIAW